MTHINGDSELCSGCFACKNVCPCDAISENIDAHGFIRPTVNETICCDCGRCMKVCQIEKSPYKHEQEPKVYALKSIDNNKRMESQSGGAFYTFAENIISKNGIVYGVKITNDFKADYVRVDNLKELKSLRGSKYVQATLHQVYSQVHHDLLLNKKVLFSGTPCHVDGLLRFLHEIKVDISRLITIDLVCHGVPSPLIFKDYIQLLEKGYKRKVLSFNFRDKNRSDWHSHVCSYDNGRKMVSQNYVDIFYSHLTLRDCCYSCQYTSINRISDITIGDYWGIEKILPDWDDNIGISLVLVNTSKGQEIFDDILDEIESIESNTTDCLQPNLQHPTSKPSSFHDFWNDYDKLGFESTIKKYCNYDKTRDWEWIENREVLKRIMRLLEKKFKKE